MCPNMRDEGRSTKEEGSTYALDILAVIGQPDDPLVGDLTAVRNVQALQALAVVAVYEGRSLWKFLCYARLLARILCPNRTQEGRTHQSSLGLS